MTTSHPPRPQVDTGPDVSLRSADSALLSKVPQITVLFWVVKVLTTGMGEAASDWLLNRGEGQRGPGVPSALIIDVGPRRPSSTTWTRTNAQKSPSTWTATTGAAGQTSPRT